MEIVADNPEQAIQRVKDGEGDEAVCEYSHTLDSETWSVEDARGNEAREQYPHGLPGRQ